MDQLSGLIDHIIFSSDETGFAVVRLKMPRQPDPITAVGLLSAVKIGETLHCKGLWKHHPQYGRQFEIESFKLTPPDDLLGIQRYLGSGMVKGIGPVYAERIVEAFGVKTLEVIDKTPDRLTEVPGLGVKRVEKIQGCWKEQRGVRDVMIFLQAHHVRPSLAQKIFKNYGEESIDKVKENPYSLAKQIDGIGFKSADELARNLGIGKDSPARIRAGIEHLLREMSNNDGHVCFPKEMFLPEAEKILEVEAALIEEQMTLLELEGHIMLEPLERIPHLWVRRLYMAEWGIARELRRIKGAPAAIRPVLIDKAIDWVQEKHRIRFATEQKQAIFKSLEEKVHIITGGPGTGKSTITRAILSIISRVTDQIVLSAPTGRAAKRMTEITGKKAFTIHSLLEFDFNKRGFKRSRDNPLTARLIIVDEASMIDTFLMHSLLKAIPDQTRLIFIGDIDQLPSVGPGNILKDMIDSETAPMTRLKFIFRQGKGSRIVANAHRINAGYFPKIESEQGSDFIFFNIESPEEIVSKIVHLIECRIPEKFPFHPIDDIQVLSPMKKGIIGTDNLNRALQQKLNPQPQPRSLEWMGRRFNLYDKVMQIRNNYDKKVYNGDVGRIASLNAEDQQLVVRFDGKEVSYDFAAIDELMLAYAVSVHKYQGSECPCVIIPVHTSHFKLLFRNLLYTAITRGKKLVILLGTKKALAIAVKTDNVKTRYTGLQYFLRSLHSAVSSPTVRNG